MSHTVPTQHPAVVLRSQYRHVRALLLVAMFAVVGLSVTTAILAIDDNPPASTATGSPLSQIDHAQRGRTNFEVRPSESNVAAAIAGNPSVATPDRSKSAWSTTARESAPAQPTAATRPDESTVAQAISGANRSDLLTRPDESKVASAISNANRPDPISRPDESAVAEAISGR